MPPARGACLLNRSRQACPAQHLGGSVMDVLTGIAALSQAINIAKFIRETEKDLQGAEIKSRMVELYEKLSDAKMALVDARDDLRSKDEEIAELKKRFEFREATVKHQGFRY